MRVPPVAAVHCKKVLASAGLSSLFRHERGGGVLGGGVCHGELSRGIVSRVGARARSREPNFREPGGSRTFASQEGAEHLRAGNIRELHR